MKKSTLTVVSKHDTCDSRVATSLRGAGLRALGCIAMMGTTASAVMAQSENLRPPKTKDPSSAPTILVYAVAVLLVGAVILAGILKSKRTHQD